MKSSTKKLYNCKICNKTGFTSTYKLNSHLFLHKAVAPRFKCHHCLKEYYRTDEYKRHMAVHEKQQKYHVCDHCGRGFVDKRNLIKHLYIHDDLHVATKRYTCLACDVSYCEERLLKYHIRKQHMNLDPDIPTHVKKELNDSWIESAMDSQSCVQITKVKNNMLSIKKCKIKTKREVKDVKERNALQQYMASMFALKDNLYSKAICDYCNKEMLKKSLIVHIRERHAKMRRFHCLVCKRGFNRHYHLTEHNCGRVRRTKRNQFPVKNQV